MRINTGFRFGAMIGGFILCAAMLSFGYNQMQITDAVSKKAILENVIFEGMELVQITNEVLLYRNKRVTQQWWDQYHQEVNLIGAGNRPVQGKSAVLWERISTNLANMQVIFERLSAHIEMEDLLSTPASTKSILSSQLFQKAVLLQTALSRLNEVAQSELEKDYRQTRERMVLTFGMFFIAISLLFLVSSFLFRKRVMQPLRKLEMSIHRVNEGDVRHRAQVYNEDEIGVVCNAFNELIDQQEQNRWQLLEREQRLSEALAEQQLILDNAVVGIAFIKENHFVSVNHKLEEIFGFSAAEIVGQSTDIVYAETGDVRNFELAAQPLLEQSDSYSNEIRIKRKDGTLCWCLMSGKLIDPCDAAQGSIWIIHDISDRREAQQNLKLLNETLERRVQEELSKNREKDHLLIQQSRLAAMGEMIHNIAHQWRQPINALSLLLGNIRDAYDYKELTRAYLDEEVKVGQGMIRSMSNTIDDFRNFFAPSKGKSIFSVQQTLAAAITMVEAALKYNEISIAILPAEVVMVDGHPNEFAQVLVNLFTNAKDAIMQKNSRNGKILCAFGQVEGLAWLTITDNGGGVSPEAQGKVFDPYFTTKGANGTGIGLYMSKMILNKMDGDIHIQNVRDGAEVRITLPLARLHHESATDAEQDKQSL